MQCFPEEVQVCAGFNPVDMQTGTNAGDWINLANYHRCAIVLYKGIGTAGDDPIITLLQATSAAGAGSKALNFYTIWYKQGTLTAVGQYTNVRNADIPRSSSAANTFLHTDSAENAGIYVLDVKGDSLDVDNGFKFISVSVADVGGNAQLGCMLYFPYIPRDSGASMPSALV